MRSKIRGVFVNNKKAQDSIFESGLMVYQCLKLSDQYDLDYIEINSEQRNIPGGFDFYFFNYHPATMYWLDTRQLKKQLNGLVITMVLEVAPGDPFVLCPRQHFDLYCVLDPSLRAVEKNVFAFPRPLEEAVVNSHTHNDIPVIGTFGFATRGKGFQHVVDAVNKEFDQAQVRINIPFGSFVPDSEAYSKKLAEICMERAKPGIEVKVTHEYFSKQELIDWCTGNTLNCFLYDRNMPGLAATTDQAIVSGRPLSVSNNDTFRHILTYLPPYPDWSLKRSIAESEEIVSRMKADWSPKNFANKFEQVLDNFSSDRHQSKHASENIQLQLRKDGLFDKASAKFHRYRRKYNLKGIKQFLTTKWEGRNEELI